MKTGENRRNREYFHWKPVAGTGRRRGGAAPRADRAAAEKSADAGEER
jgi:hypothetical protein